MQGVPSMNAALNLELVGAASPEPSADGRSDTRGEMEALAVGQPTTKPLSLNRELEPVRPQPFAEGH